MNIPTTNAQLNTGSSNPGIKWDTVLLMQYPPNAITATMIRLKVSGSMEMEEQELSPMLSRLSPGIAIGLKKVSIYLQIFNKRGPVNNAGPQ